MSDAPPPQRAERSEVAVEGIDGQREAQFGGQGLRRQEVVSPLGRSTHERPPPAAARAARVSGAAVPVTRSVGMRTLDRVRLLAACAALALSGCGGGDEADAKNNAERFEGDERQVAEVVDRLGEAAREGDTATICEDLVTAELQTRIREASGTSCAQELEENIVSGETTFEVESIEVKSDDATAVVVDQEGRKSRLFMVRDQGDWRITRIG